MRDPGRIPSGRDTGASAARRREDAELVWPGGAGAGGDCGNGTVFGARREKRTAAMADRIADPTEAGLSDPRRTGGGAILTTGDFGEVSVESVCGAVFGYGGDLSPFLRINLAIKRAQTGHDFSA